MSAMNRTVLAKLLMLDDETRTPRCSALDRAGRLLASLKANERENPTKGTT